MDKKKVENRGEGQAVSRISHWSKAVPQGRAQAELEQTAIVLPSFDACTF